MMVNNTKFKVMPHDRYRKKGGIYIFPRNYGFRISRFFFVFIFILMISFTHINFLSLTLL